MKKSIKAARTALAVCIAVHLLSIRAAVIVFFVSYLMTGLEKNITIGLTWQLRMGAWKCSYI